MTEPSQLRATRRTVLTAGAANVVVLAEKLPVTPHVFVDPTSRNEARLLPPTGADDV
jgi:hypothetical protein